MMLEVLLITIRFWQIYGQKIEKQNHLLSALIERVWQSETNCLKDYLRISQTKPKNGCGRRCLASGTTMVGTARRAYPVRLALSWGVLLGSRIPKWSEYKPALIDWLFAWISHCKFVTCKKKKDLWNTRELSNREIAGTKILAGTASSGKRMGNATHRKRFLTVMRNVVSLSRHLTMCM